MKIATFKAGDPPHLAEISIRHCQGRKGFPTIGTSTLRDEIDTEAGLKLINELVDMAGGILWLCWEEELFTKIHPPLLIYKYSSLLEKIKENRKMEDSLRLQIDDFRHDNLKLIEAMKVEIKEREQIGFDLDDAQNKILRLQDIIDQYEEASLR
ncbi:unnamed protein product [marine sediment metagenome]|uniref:Uncharacterized protein n=1 Tax=marine sediment metagenome TaxID=412755 RepID=X1JED7_9ZZZZ